MKIIASDFDKTLFVDDKDTVIKNVNSINDFVKDGNIFILVTGRIYSDIKLLLDEYNIKYNYLICEDGTKIFNNLDYSIKDYLLPRKKVKKIEEILNKYELEYYLDDGYNTTENKDDCIKINSKITDRELFKKVLKEIKDNVEVYAYLSKSFLNITDSSTSKAIALEYLMAYEDLNEKDLYVIGDDVNDVEMIKRYRGYVMSDHSEELNNISKKEFETFYEFVDYIKNT